MASRIAAVGVFLILVLLSARLGASATTLRPSEASRKGPRKLATYIMSNAEGAADDTLDAWMLTSAGEAAGAGSAGTIGGEETGDPKPPEQSPPSASGGGGQATTHQLELFVDPLPIPAVIPAPEDGSKLSITAFSVKRKLHRDLPATPVYAFGLTAETASVPGPTILARRGQKLVVQWVNNISDAQHFLPVDHTLGVPVLKKGGVPICVHVHGGMVPSTSDGHPLSWWTKNGEVGPTFVSTDHEYPNIQPARTLWYHDHTVGMTRLNVAAGLSGLYILRDESVEEALGLPQGEYDVPLVLSDKSLDHRTGAIQFPLKGVNPALHPTWSPEYFGDYILVNGKVSPFLEVQPTQYRFRILNAANARFFTLKLNTEMSLQPGITRFTRLTFFKVANDGGFLQETVERSDVTIGPGERAEVIIDFSSLGEGATVTLTNSAPAPYDAGEAPMGPQQKVMLFKVQGKSATAGALSAQTSVPKNLATFSALDPKSAVTKRIITMSEKINAVTGEPEYSLLEGLHFRDNVTVKPQMGTTEIWSIINLTEDWHTLHIHFAPHQLIQRQSFDLEGYLAGNCTLTTDNVYTTEYQNFENSCLTGAAVPAEDEARSWKDTTQIHTGKVTTLIIKFDAAEGETLTFDPTVGPGYVFHCHMVDHEDNDMMRPFTIVKAE